MLPAERKNRIKQWIQTEHSMKISDLSAKLGVSEMTVHRDVKSLVEEGWVIKTFGGISLARSINERKSPDECVFCSRKMNETLAYRLILPNDQIETACCAHCGLLRHQHLGDKVIQAMCRDFLRRTTISATLASFVMDTTLDIGCCQPQVLTFEHAEDARKFVKGFGGEVFSFSEAMESLGTRMSGHACTDE